MQSIRRLSWENNRLLAVCAAVFFIIGIGMPYFPMSPALAGISALAIVGFALPSYIAMYSANRMRALTTILALGCFGIAVESFAVATGIPYGAFSYNDMLGGKVLGLAPWTIACAWPPIVLGAAYLAQRSKLPAALSFFAALALLVAPDLLLDPGAVALGFWKWEASSWFYGIPFSNYIGWCVSGAVGLSIVKALWRSQLPPGAVWSYMLTLAFWTGAMVGLTYWLAAAIGVALLTLAARLLSRPIIATR